MVGVKETPDLDGPRADRHLEEELQRWLAASIISAEQAEAIRRTEAEEASRAPSATRIPLIAEALGLLGGALAAIAGIVATSRFWNHFPTPVRLAIVGTVAALMVVAGKVVRREGEPALAHLGSFLWLVAASAAGFWSGLLAADVLGWDGPDRVFLIGVVSLAVGAALWAWEAAPLQHVATLAALAITVGGIAGQVQHIGGLYIGIGLWALGVTWAVLAWDRVIAPPPLGYALGGVLAVVGAMVGAGGSTWGDVLAIITALALVAASVSTRSIVLLWVGVIGVFVAVPSTIFEHFGNSIGVPVALFLVGMVLVGVAVGASRLARELRAAPPTKPRYTQRTVSGALLGVVALVVALIVGITQVQMTGVPTFPSLRTTPDASIAGSIAFLRQHGRRTCVMLIPASGATTATELLCERDIGGGPGAVMWSQTGHVVVLQYSPTGPPQAVEIDPADGQIVARRPSQDLPEWANKGFLQRTDRRSSDGATLSIEDLAGGKTRLVVRKPSAIATRTVIETRGPRDYRFDYAAWSADGKYAAVVDSEHRLLVVAIDFPTPNARVLVTDASFPAWSSWVG